MNRLFALGRVLTEDLFLGDSRRVEVEVGEARTERTGGRRVTCGFWLVYTNAGPDTAFSTHSIYLRSRVSDQLNEYRKLLGHELLHILMREYHSWGGADDETVSEYNLFRLGRRITTANYLSCNGYSVTSSFSNQEEKVRTSPLLRTLEN